MVFEDHDPGKVVVFETSVIILHVNVSNSTVLCLNQT